MATLVTAGLGSNDATGTTLQLTVAQTWNAGDLVVCGAKHEGGSTTLGVDVGGSQFSASCAYARHSNNDLGAQILHWKATATGTFNPTLTSGNVPFREMACLVFRPAAGKELVWVSQATVGQGNSSAPAAGAALANGGAGAAAHFVGMYGTRTRSAVAPWSIAAQHSSGTPTATAYQLPAAAGSLTAQAVSLLSGAVDYISNAAFFIEQDVGGGNATVVPIINILMREMDRLRRARRFLDLGGMVPA